MDGAFRTFVLLSISAIYLAILGGNLLAHSTIFVGWHRRRLVFYYRSAIWRKFESRFPMVSIVRRFDRWSVLSHKVRAVSVYIGVAAILAAAVIAASAVIWLICKV